MSSANLQATIIDKSRIANPNGTLTFWIKVKCIIDSDDVKRKVQTTVNSVGRIQQQETLDYNTGENWKYIASDDFGPRGYSLHTDTYYSHLQVSGDTITCRLKEIINNREAYISNATIEHRYSSNYNLLTNKIEKRPRGYSYKIEGLQIITLATGQVDDTDSMSSYGEVYITSTDSIEDLMSKGQKYKDRSKAIVDIILASQHT